MFSGFVDMTEIDIRLPILLYYCIIFLLDNPISIW